MKRIIALTLTLLLAFGCIFTASAVNLGTINGFSGSVTMEETFDLGQGMHYNDLEVRMGDEVRIPLTADMFTYDSDRNTLPYESIKVAELKRGRIRCGTKVRSGSEVLDYIQFDTDIFDGQPFFASGTTRRTGQTAYVSIMFAKDFPLIEDTDFEFTVSIEIDNEMVDELTLAGTMVVDVQEIDESTTQVDLFDNLVVESDTFLKNVEFDIGNDLTIDSSVLPNKRIYGRCKVLENAPEIVEVLNMVKYGTTEDYEDMVYPEVKCVYQLMTKNMSPAAKATFELEDEDAEYFIYNKSFQYLGTTKDEKLPFSSLYILTKVKMPEWEGLDYSE